MNESNLPKFHTTWKNIIHAFLVSYTYCSCPLRGRSQSRINATLKNIEGFGLFGEDSKPDLPAVKHIPALHMTENSGLPGNEPILLQMLLRWTLVIDRNEIKSWFISSPSPHLPLARNMNSSLSALSPFSNRWTLCGLLQSIILLISSPLPPEKCEKLLRKYRFQTRQFTP